MIVYTLHPSPSLISFPPIFFSFLCTMHWEFMVGKAFIEKRNENIFRRKCVWLKGDLTYVSNTPQPPSPLISNSQHVFTFFKIFLTINTFMLLKRESGQWGRKNSNSGSKQEKVQAWKFIIFLTLPPIIFVYSF